MRLNNSCSIQSNFLPCAYTNTDSVLNKRSELLTVIGNECHDIICIIGTIPKNQRGIDSVEFQFQDFDCFYNLGQKLCRRGVAMWVRKRLGAQEIKSLEEFQAARESMWCELTLQDKDCLLVGTVCQVLDWAASPEQLYKR